MIFNGIMGKFNMNKQEIFDKVATHLLTQNKKSSTTIRCWYRSPEGLKCAIGCLIPDHLYDKSIEGCGSFNLPKTIIDYIGLNDTSDRYFLSNLQKIHDNYEPPMWKHKLKELAGYYQLVWSQEES